MRILISLPVFKRSWILPLWFEFIEKQSIDLSNLGFAFLVAPYEQDPETHDVLLEWFSRHPSVWAFSIIPEPNVKHEHHEEGQRTIWERSAYTKMALMRNSLLAHGRSLEPDYYFSLDSDILLEDPETIKQLMDLTEPGTAVSPLMYMWHCGVNFPSVMTWAPRTNFKAYRPLNSYNLGTFFKSDVIMAAVMMSKEVYMNTNYSDHPLGEDLGWSVDCYKKGFKLYSASHIYCPHIMHKSMKNFDGPKGPGILDYYLKHGDDRRPEKVLVDL